MTDTPERDGNIAAAARAYSELMDAIVPESKYWQGVREDPEEIRVLGDIIDRAAARNRALLAEEGANPAPSRPGE